MSKLERQRIEKENAARKSEEIARQERKKHEDSERARLKREDEKRHWNTQIINQQKAKKEKEILELEEKSKKYLEEINKKPKPETKE